MARGLVFDCSSHIRCRQGLLVQLYSGNVVFLGRLSLVEYQLHRVQRFNIYVKVLSQNRFAATRFWTSRHTMSL